MEEHAKSEKIWLEKLSWLQVYHFNLIKGGNAGIGAEAAKKLGEMGADIIIGCRDLFKA